MPARLDRPRADGGASEAEFVAVIEDQSGNSRGSWPRRVQGEVRFDDGSRALYATDASNYRQVPIGVVIPRTIEDVVATIALCRRFGAPIVIRGGGTSLAGQGCNVAVLIDFSKYLNRVLSNSMQRTASRESSRAASSTICGCSREQHTSHLRPRSRRPTTTIRSAACSATIPAACIRSWRAARPTMSSRSTS